MAMYPVSPANDNDTADSRFRDKIVLISVAIQYYSHYDYVLFALP